MAFHTSAEVKLVITTINVKNVGPTNPRVTCGLYLAGKLLLAFPEGYCVCVHKKYIHHVLVAGCEKKEPTAQLHSTQLMDG